MSESIRRLLPDDIGFRISDATEAIVKIDPTELERALLNLVINARDSIDGQGEITLGCRSAELSGDSIKNAGTYVEIQVRDSGCGMTDDVQAKVFEPFYTTKPVGQGTGMGMAILQGVINEAGGDVKIDSAVGAGTTVSIYIPQADKPVVNDPATSVEVADDGETSTSTNASILVVEDNPDVLTVTAMTIEGAGFTVATATDGDSALGLLKNDGPQFDLLCIDGVIPGTSSASVIEFVQQNYPGMRVVVCSGYIEEDLLLRGIQTGDLAYVKKPYLASELLQCIRDELRQAEQASPH